MLRGIVRAAQLLRSSAAVLGIQIERCSVQLPAGALQAPPALQLQQPACPAAARILHRLHSTTPSQQQLWQHSAGEMYAVRSCRESANGIDCCKCHSNYLCQQDVNRCLSRFVLNGWFLLHRLAGDLQHQQPLAMVLQLKQQCLQQQMPLLQLHQQRAMATKVEQQAAANPGEVRPTPVGHTKHEGPRCLGHCLYLWHQALQAQEL